MNDGEIVVVGDHAIQVYHTPGHSPGSVCLTVGIKGVNVLIAGDALWGGFHSSVGSNMDDWIVSLDRLQQLDVDALTFGHCPPTLFWNAKERIREAGKQLGVYFNPWFKPFHTKFHF